MAIALAIFSLIIVLLSAYGVFQPSVLTSFVRRFMAGFGLWVAVVARLILALLLWFSAPFSHTPLTFQVLAILALVAAIALPIIGGQRILKLLDWVASWQQLAIRLWCLLGVGFGGFLLWSISPIWAAA
ncbi:hypothetical protein MnTg02_01909 [bacterium MnTg02]|nr:hypothetical protein MnTg02_01909 [bacterium MnTg02]